MQLRKVASSLSVLGVQGRVQALVSSMRATDDLPTRSRNVVVTGGPQVTRMSLWKQYLLKRQQIGQGRAGQLRAK